MTDDPLTARDMPGWLHERHQQLARAAYDSYGYRDAAREAFRIDDATAYNEEGDRFLDQAYAISTEWTP